jgi:hypothetical protein
MMTRYFLDTEFIDTGSTIDLISIGIVSSDGREYYAQDCTCDLSKASDWVQENVIVHLAPTWKSREQIQRDLLAFMDVEQYGKPALYGWCCAYDFVALCQLFGTMMDLPQDWPHYMRDIQFVLDDRGISDDALPQPEGQVHNALVDARQIRDIWQMLYPPRSCEIAIDGKTLVVSFTEEDVRIVRQETDKSFWINVPESRNAV